MKRLRVLVIEDSPSDAELVRRNLIKAGYDVFTKRVDSDLEVRESISKESWDVILADYNLPGFSALDALNILKATKKDIPFILISGVIGEPTAVEVMKAGASDFIAKGDLSRLIPAIEREIREFRNRVIKQQLYNRFQKLTEAIPQLVWITKSNGTVDFLNYRWFEYTGQNEAPSNLKDWEKVVHPDDLPKLLGEWKRAVERNGAFEIESRIRRADDAYLWHLIRSVPAWSEEGQLNEWFGTATNIEAQKRAILIRDEFLSLASHELKTPLTSLSLRLDALNRSIDCAAQDSPFSLKLYSVIEICIKQVERLTALIEDLLDVSRIQLGRLQFVKEPVDFSDLIIDVVTRYSEEIQRASCTISLKLEPHLVGRWDGPRLEQIVINLLTNAIKYAAGSDLQISLKKEGQDAIFRIKDTGPGIPNERHATIFQRFERATSIRNISGLGLGLFIVDQIVKGHGGNVALESQLGKGSTFIVRLPINADSTSESNANYKRVAS